MPFLDLNGTWKMRWTDGQRGRAEYANRDQVDAARYFDAQVPGEVHLDLWKQGIIADPYVGTNCLAARWVEECIWSYRREFDATAEMLAGKSWLVFEELDLAATIVLNGVEIGKHKNVFYPCRLETTGKLKPGKNVLAVHLDSGLYDVSEKPSAGYNFQKDAILHKRQWLRKPQSQFSWDWSTRLINVGITKSVRLEYCEPTARVDQLVPLAELSADLTRGSVRARLFVEGLVAAAVKGKLTVELPGTGIKQEKEIDIAAGLHPYELTIAIDRPKLWWPIGHGEQPMYPLKVTLTVAGKVIAEKKTSVGFRHVRINQEKHPETGQYFIFEINGRKIFCKGANFVPADMIFARIDRERYDKLTDLALEANLNFLRVWGGGLYESDDFFELCDAKGILVWQEFIFACARYPVTDEAFYNDIKLEAVHNIRRLASHPCLVAWCGNNEMEEGTWNWGYDKGIVFPDYSFFHLTLPRLMAQEDPTRYYQPSSPYSPDHLPPNADHVGDQHPWSIGFFDTDFHKYRDMISRFPNEGGILGPTSLPSMLACLPEGQQKVQSFAWQVHDNSIDSWAEPSPPDLMIEQWVGRDPRTMTIEDFTFTAGLVQAEGLKEYCENFRRRMFSSSAAIFWMFNDCWPAVRSWTIVDYHLNRTPCFHAVKRAMSPVHVVLAKVGEQVKVYGVNDTQEAVSADLRYGVFNLAGAKAFAVDRPAKVTLAPNSSTEIASFAMADWSDQKTQAAFATLERGGVCITRNRLFLPKFKELKFAKPNLKVRVAKGQAIFEADEFVWGVCIDLDGGQPLSDNMFDVFPGMPHRIAWNKPTPPKILHVGNL